MIARLFYASLQSPGGAKLIGMENSLVKRAVGTCGSSHMLVHRKEFTEEEFRIYIMQSAGQIASNHWSKILPSISKVLFRVPRLTTSTVIHCSNPFEIPISVGYGTSVSALLHSDLKSLQYDEMVSDRAFEHVLALICSGRSIFSSKFSAVVMATHSDQQWYYKTASSKSKVRGRVRDFNSHLFSALEFVDIILVPINVENKHWHIMVVDSRVKRIIYFDPYHLEILDLCGDPSGRMSSFKVFIQNLSDGNNRFKDISLFEEVIAHEGLERRMLPRQNSGNGCAMHCAAFAANVIADQHVHISDFETRKLRVIFSSLLNSPDTHKIICNKDLLSRISQADQPCVTDAGYGSQLSSTISEPGGGESSKSSMDFVQDEQSWAGTYSTDTLYIYVLFKSCQKIFYTYI
jgi:hypothetical protein